MLAYPLGIYESFVVMGVVGEVSLNFLHGEREKWKNVCFSSFQASLHLPFPPYNQEREAPQYFPIKTKAS